MKKMLPLVLLGVACFQLFSYGQAGKKIKVTYLVQNYAASPKENKKLVHGKDTTTLNDWGIAAFTVDEELVATDKETVISFKVNSRGYAGTDDPYIYKNKTWYRKGSETPLPECQMTATETKDHKTILGYDCIKFICTMTCSSDQQTMEIWASPKISNMVFPISGVREFKYGVLEINELGKTWSQKATRIEFID